MECPVCLKELETGPLLNHIGQAHHELYQLEFRGNLCDYICVCGKRWPIYSAWLLHVLPELEEHCAMAVLIGIGPEDIPF